MADLKETDSWTEAIREYNRILAKDGDMETVIIPVRDGVSGRLRGFITDIPHLNNGGHERRSLMVKFATLSVSVPDGREVEAVAQAKAHLKAVRYRILLGGYPWKVVGMRTGGKVAAFALILFFLVGLFLFWPLLVVWFLGLIAYVVVYRPNRVMVWVHEDGVGIGYKGADGYLQAIALKGLLEDVGAEAGEG